MKRPALSLTSQIVLLVASMGIACAMITGYATWHMQRTESQYHHLLQQQATATLRIGVLRQHIGEATSLVHSALTVDNEQHALNALEELSQLQKTLSLNVLQLQALLPEQHVALQQVANDATPFFVAGTRVIQNSLQWDDEHAFQLLNTHFAPTHKALNTAVVRMRADAQHSFNDRAQALAEVTRRTTTKTLLAAWLSIWLISALAAWIAWRHISRPIGRLTERMQSLQQQQYDLPIADQHRVDEIGDMARALQSFAMSLQEVKRLGEKLERHQHDALLMERWQRLSSALPGAVFQLQLRPGHPLRLRFISPQWVQLMGLPADTDTSLHNAAQTILTHNPGVYALSEKHYRESAHTLQPVDFAVSIEMLDGVTRWIKTRANPYLESDGSVTFNGVWLDVSKEMMQSRALEKAKRQAEQSAMERSFLQASISHEIRTPLNAILGLTQLLLKSDLPAAQREQLHHVLRAGQHLRGIVNEVLDFSKIDAGQLQLESTDFSLENVVLDVLSMCHEEASKKGLSIHYKMAREVPDGLRGDPHRIAQILLNYVNNAIKFTAAGHIHIALRLDPCSTLHRVVLHVSVQDTGPGIPADRISLLFEPFRQADNSITRRFGGTGLGLTISRALAQLMGGSAGVESTLGQGSTFWFTAMLEPARTAVHRNHTPALIAQGHSTPKGWQGLRVLVVDDNPLNRAVAEGMLHMLGIQVETAEDGAQAIKKLQEVGPTYYACVLMDIQMPHIDGLSATQAIRQQPGFTDLPIIAMTAHTAMHDVERALAAGINAHLSKPLLESSLHQVLQAWLCHEPPSPISAQESPASVLPPEFDASAMDALAQLFNHDKLQQLVQQFTQDSLQRARQLPELARQHDWQGMRAEAHKLTGTAATFGLMELGHLSSTLSADLKNPDAERIQTLARQITQSTECGVAQLQAYCVTMTIKQ